MVKRGRTEISFNRPGWRQNGTAMRFGDSHQLRERLLREIVELESRLGRAESEGGGTDFALVEAYREMIRSRRAFYQQLDT